MSGMDASDFDANLKQLHLLRQQQEPLFRSINAAQKKLKRKKTPGADSEGTAKKIKIEKQLLLQLHHNYLEAVLLASEELRTTTTAIERLQRVIASKQHEERQLTQSSSHQSSSSKTLASTDKGANSHFPPTHIPSSVVKSQKSDIWFYHVDGAFILPEGTEVAALTDLDCKPKLWILAVIKSYDASRQRYRVEDTSFADDTPAGHKSKKDGAAAEKAVVRKVYDLDPRRILPLPSLKEAPLYKRKQFPKGQRVLAIYPLTTVLYPAYVVDNPKKTRTDMYLLRFDDDDEEDRKIDARLVAPVPDEFYEAPSPHSVNPCDDEQ